MLSTHPCLYIYIIFSSSQKQPEVFSENDVKEQQEEVMEYSNLDQEEPLLKENTRRFVLFPIQHHDIWQFYKKAEGMLVC